MERQKGKSLLNFSKDYCVVDLDETSPTKRLSEKIWNYS